MVDFVFSKIIMNLISKQINHVPINLILQNIKIFLWQFKNSKLDLKEVTVKNDNWQKTGELCYNSVVFKFK